MEIVEQRVTGIESTLAEVLASVKELVADRKAKKVTKDVSSGGSDGDAEVSPVQSPRSRPSRKSEGFETSYRGGRRKLEIPVFKGDDAHGWLVRVERYFRVNQVREAEKLDAVVIALEERALNWFQWWEEQAPLRTWGDFKNSVIRRFHPESLHNPLGPLLGLRQEGTVMEYREKFELLVAPLAREDRVLLEDIFLNGLKEEIKAEIKLYGYDDLSSLMDRALLLEEKNLALSKKSRGVNDRADWRGGGTKYKNTWENSKWRKEENRGGWKETEKSEGKSMEAGKNRRLSTAELEEKLKKGLCFKCGDKWGRDHVCKLKHMKLMLCEGDTDSEGEEIVEEVETEVVEEMKTLQLSLHSKEGLTSNKSFKVWAYIGGRRVLVLIDSGATSNFISPRLVEALELLVDDTPIYVVEIGTGDKVRNKGVCKKLKFTVQGVEFIQNFFLMELGELKWC